LIPGGERPCALRPSRPRGQAAGELVTPPSAKATVAGRAGGVGGGGGEGILSVRCPVRSRMFRFLVKIKRPVVRSAATRLKAATRNHSR